jgi:hypothetical protein
MGHDRESTLPALVQRFQRVRHSRL